jgi:hypothetical protein
MWSTPWGYSTSLSSFWQCQCKPPLAVERYFLLLYRYFIVLLSFLIFFFFLICDCYRLLCSWGYWWVYSSEVYALTISTNTMEDIHYPITIIYIYIYIYIYIARRKWHLNQQNYFWNLKNKNKKIILLAIFSSKLMCYLGVTFLVFELEFFIC